MSPRFGTQGRTRRLKRLFLKIRNVGRGGTFAARRALQGPAQFQSLLFDTLTLLISEKTMHGTRKGRKFWTEKLITNWAGELGFRGLSFPLPRGQALC